MDQPIYHSRFTGSVSNSGTWPIAIGLLILILAAWIPALPAVTAMAMITFGATVATLARFQGNAAMRPLIVLHAATYATLYALFVGATLHAFHAGPASSAGHWVLFDLAASVLPLGLAGQRIAWALSRS